MSWLDHCISTEDGNDIITNAHVVYESIQSDHLPVVFELHLMYSLVRATVMLAELIGHYIK